MNDGDQDKFKSIMASIAGIYNCEFAIDQIKLWWNVFKNISIDNFEAAVYAHIADPDQGMFIPKPANIMRHINGTEKENSQALDDKAILAWAFVLKEISRLGSYRTFKSDDPAIISAIRDLGGWIKLCGATQNELTWIKKEFIGHYKALTNSGATGDSKPLLGREDLSKKKLESKSSTNNLLKQLEKRQNEKA